MFLSLIFKPLKVTKGLKIKLFIAPEKLDFELEKPEFRA